jgi:hypothetical protein
MDIQARYLVFHSTLVLLGGLLVGVPYGRAVHLIEAWRLAHDTLTLGRHWVWRLLPFSRRSVLAPRSSPGWRGRGWCRTTDFVSRFLRRHGRPARPHVDRSLSNQRSSSGTWSAFGASSVGTVVLLYAAYVSLPWIGLFRKGEA